MASGIHGRTTRKLQEAIITLQRQGQVSSARCIPCACGTSRDGGGERPPALPGSADGTHGRSPPPPRGLPATQPENPGAAPLPVPAEPAAAPPGRSLTAAELRPEGGGGGGAAAGGGRRAAVPALVSELAAALLEAQARSLPDRGHQLRLLLAQLLLPAAQRRAGAARLLGPAGRGDAQPPAEAAPVSAGPRRTRGDGLRAALPPYPAPGYSHPGAAGGGAEGEQQQQQRPQQARSEGSPAPHGRRIQPRRAAAPACGPAPGSRDRGGLYPGAPPYSGFSPSRDRARLARRARAVGHPSWGGWAGREGGGTGHIGSARFPSR